MQYIIIPLVILYAGYIIEMYEFRRKQKAERKRQEAKGYETI